MRTLFDIGTLIPQPQMGTSMWHGNSEDRLAVVTRGSDDTLWTIVEVEEEL